MPTEAELERARRLLHNLSRRYCRRCGHVMFVAWRTPALHTVEHCDDLLAYVDDLERRQRRNDFSA